MEDMLRVGVITSTHGIRGEVKVFPTTDDPLRFKKLKKCVIDGKREQVAVTVSSVKFFKQFVILKFKEFDDINDIEKYTKCDLLVSREDAVKLGPTACARSCFSSWPRPGPPAATDIYFNHLTHCDARSPAVSVLYQRHLGGDHHICGFGHDRHLHRGAQTCSHLRRCYPRMLRRSRTRMLSRRQPAAHGRCIRCGLGAGRPVDIGATPRARGFSHSRGVVHGYGHRRAVRVSHAGLRAGAECFPFRKYTRRYNRRPHSLRRLYAGVGRLLRVAFPRDSNLCVRPRFRPCSRSAGSHGDHGDDGHGSPVHRADNPSGRHHAADVDDFSSADDG